MASLVDDERVVDAFVALPIDSGSQLLTDFIAVSLNLNASQKAEICPDADSPADDTKRVVLDRIAASLDARRLKVLKEEAKISNAVLTTKPDAAGGKPEYSVMGLLEFLRNSGAQDAFLQRVRLADTIRTYLTGIGDGLKLEAIAAILLKQQYESCRATRRSFDQGVDCFATQPILELESWCCAPDMIATVQKTGEKLHIIASCKANEGNIAGGIPSTISPAHTRELIGAWLIQRSDSGMWQKAAGIKLLSPMQLLLVTTYRLSDDTMQLCRNLGVAVWSITELIYLICRSAPSDVFAPGATTINIDRMEAWIASADADRAVAIEGQL